MKVLIKKAIYALLMLALLSSLIFALSSCGGDGFQGYYEYGLKYRLPDYFRKRNIQGTEIYYSTPGASFEVEIMSRTEIDADDSGYEFDFTISVEEYTKFFISENEWGCDYEYDEERNISSFYIFWAPVEDEYKYYYFTILKSNDALYVVIMSCDEDKYENYEPLFREWGSYLEAVDA